MSKYIRIHIPTLGIGCLLLVLLTWGCSDQGKNAQTSATQTSAKAGKIFAEVGDSPLYENELRQYLETRPLSRSGKSGREAFTERVDELVTSELLYQEAISQGLDQDPRIRQIIRQMLAQKILEKEVNKVVRNHEISDEEIRRYYDAHIDEFSHPEQVRIADIFLALPKEASDEERQSLQQKAEGILQQALQSKGKRFSFTGLIAKYSDKPEKYPLGHTGFFDRKGEPFGLEKALVEASFALQKNGEIADRVIATPKGFHIIMLVGKRAAWQKKLYDIKREIKERIQREEIEKKRAAYISSLRDKWDITVKEDVVDDISRAFIPKGDLLVKPSRASSAGSGMNPPAFPGEK